MKKLILSLFLSLLCSNVLADEIVTLKSGEKAILLDSGRWSIMAPRDDSPGGENIDINQTDLKTAPKKADTYREITLSDIKQDIAVLKGGQIKVRALGEMYNFILMLKLDEGDATPLSVNINRLSREDRKHLREECSQPCTVTVYGRAGDVLHDELGIIADKIVW